MLEREIERYLARRVKEAGGLCLKLAPVSMVGLPDRLCLLPNGRVFFAELKQHSGKPRAVQAAAMSRLQRLGFHVYLIDTKEKADEILSSRIPTLRGEIPNGEP